MYIMTRMGQVCGSLVSAGRGGVNIAVRFSPKVNVVGIQNLSKLRSCSCNTDDLR